MQTHLIPVVIRKDLAAFPGLFIAWAFLLLAQAGLIAVGIPAVALDPVGSGAIQTLFNLVPVLQTLLIFVAVPVIVQSDALVGTTAFWLTRPMGRSTLLAAKVLLLVGGFVIPQNVINVAVLIAGGVLPGDAVRAGAQMLLGATGVMAALMAVASVTRTFVAYVCWAFGGVFAMALLSTGFLLLGLSIAPGDGNTLADSRAALSQVFVLVGASAVVGHQYLTRRSQRSARALVAMVALWALAASLSPWNLFPGDSAPAPAGRFPADSVRPSFQPGSRGISTTTSLFDRNPTVEVSRTLELAATPSGYALSVRRVDASLEVAGKTLRSRLSADQDWRDLWRPENVRLAIGLAEPGVAATGTASVSLPVLRIPQATFEQVARTPGIYRADVALEASRIREVGRVPLLPGAKLSDGSDRLRVIAGFLTVEGCRVTAQWSTLRLGAFTRDAQSDAIGRGEDFFVLLNSRRNEVVLPESDGRISSTVGEVGPWRQRTLTLNFTDAGTPNIDAEWLAEAQLLWLKREGVGSLNREVTADPFLLDPPNP